MYDNDHGILVGYDGSMTSREAVKWAERAACDRGVTLTVCHAWEPGSAGPPVEPEHQDLAEASARWMLSTAMPHADPEAVRQILAEGPTARVLCGLSAGADMLVVGSRGLGGLTGLLLGSVSLQVAGFAVSPVVVVRGRWHPSGGYVPGHIVAGIDGSDGSDDVLTFAGTEAAMRRVPLTAVCALADAPGELGAGERLAEDFERIVTRWEKDHPEVEVHRHVTGRSARTALLESARDAQLVVVGRRGRGGLPRMPLGNVAETLLSHAPCPVAVVGT
ncbi:MAG: universal stress protein [Actinobacteria bacterium]|nr:universal stress protein [Actinomycetota bacterium]